LALVVVFVGEYDLGCKQRFREEMARLHTQADVVLDFTEVTYVDSTIIAELLRLARDRTRSGLPAHRIVVSNDSSVRHIFDLVHLGRVIPLLSSFDAVTLERPPDYVQYAFSGVRA
jgi:anti-anti-sigma factor